MLDKELASRLKIKEIRDRIEKLKHLSDDYAVETRQALEEELAVLEGAVPSSSTQRPVGNEQIKEENPKTEAGETNSHQVKLDDLPNPPEELKVEETTLLTPSLYGGRFTRLQYFLHGIPILITAPFLCIGSMIDVEEEMFCWSFLWIPWLIFYAIPVNIKRAHDYGSNGSFVIKLNLANFIALVVFILAGVFENRDFGLACALSAVIIFIITSFLSIFYGIELLFKDSEHGTNKYGTSSKYPTKKVPSCSDLFQKEAKIAKNRVKKVNPPLLKTARRDSHRIVQQKS